MATNTGTPRKPHVLIVDDDIPLAWSFKQTLEHRGLDATIVPDGGLALRFVVEHPVDAVVCDLEIARLEGDLWFAAVERLNPALARRFIFITGLGEAAPFQKFIDSAALPSLRKPVDLAVLLGEVMRVLKP